MSWRGITHLHLPTYMLVILSAISLSTAEDKQTELCLPVPNATECLLQGPQCTWCFKKEYELNLRCDTEEGHQSRNCDISFILSPISMLDYTQNVSVRNADIDRGVPAVQISPQKLEIKLYPGRPMKVPITFRIADDYPVDLYYLMDLSFSMVDDQDKLINLGQTLTEELKNISRDVRLGFGAFVDKPVMPYIGTRPVAIANPCFPRAECEPAYGFIHQLTLTTNTSIFGDEVRRTPISGNQDGPEGGLDALMQAMVCNKKIGWRKDSRKIILFSTDAKSHVALDGKIGGINEPNDGRCHLKRNIYTHSTTQDYPSISHIASVAKSTSTSIIFAVHGNTQEYQLISDLIPNSVVGELASDSSNIVSLVRDQYNNLVKTVTLGTTGLPDDLRVNFRTNCSRSDGKMLDSNECVTARIGQPVHFEVEISMEKCSANARHNFVIKPHDLVESVNINVEIVCRYDCGDEETGGNVCSGVGTYSCGVCHCDAGYAGDNCECASLVSAPTDSCLNPLTKVECSNHGTCSSCQKCQCGCLPGELEPSCDRYSGMFCECNTKSCRQKNGLICSGNGDCVCDDNHRSTSYCKCNSGYLGEDCSCPVSDITCRPSDGTGAVCNGKGNCVCGKCQCTDNCYSGPACDRIKPECSRACVSFKECVVCTVRPGESSTSCSSKSPCSSYLVKMVSDIPAGDERCSHLDQDGCRHFYKYQYNHANGSWIVHIMNEPRCQKDYWLEVIIGVCVGVLLLGILALIIWKWIVTRHDANELAKFEKEAQQAKWRSTNNPIYKPATSTFRNPMYQKPAAEEETQEDPKEM